jgi:hypothetical protein
MRRRRAPGAGNQNGPVARWMGEHPAAFCPPERASAGHFMAKPSARKWRTRPVYVIGAFFHRTGVILRARLYRLIKPSPTS